MATSPTAAPTREPGSNVVVVPRLVGASTAEALAAARASGLDWTLYCNEDGDQPAGIIDQEPPAGEDVVPARLLIEQGALPLVELGEIVAAIGVAGSPSTEQDHLACQAGLGALSQAH